MPYEREMATPSTLALPWNSVNYFKNFNKNKHTLRKERVAASVQQFVVQLLNFYLLLPS
jgi:hypothetical protein